MEEIKSGFFGDIFGKISTETIFEGVKAILVRLGLPEQLAWGICMAPLVFVFILWTKTYIKKSDE